MIGMTALLDLTGGKRVFFEDLDFDEGLPVACVLGDNGIIQLTPPCSGAFDLAFIFINGREEKRFLFIGQTDDDDQWLCDDGSIFTAAQIAELPLQIAASHTPLTPENLRRFDS